ncbi:MAG TPA: CPBP family intramembrane glutamic endopeptidase [Polyangia bacterium]
MAAAVSSALVWSHLMELPIDRESELMKRVQSEPFGWLKMGMLMVVVGPLIEELMIRGRIQTALENRLGRATGILIAALVFSLAHFDAVKVPSLLVIGIVLGTAVSFTGSVWVVESLRRQSLPSRTFGPPHRRATTNHEHATTRPSDHQEP